MRRISIVLSMLVLLVASNAMALGPLLVFDPVTSTPYAYPGPVTLYTDNDPMFSNTAPMTGADADNRVADAAAAWTGVATASLSASVGGDFASIGLPDITYGNETLVLGVFNGGGYHVIYDHDGSIIAAYAGPGVLGFSSPEYATTGTPDLTESYAVLNGATVEPGDVIGTWWQGVITHEMGHGINLAHTQCNGAALFFGDDTGPAGCALPYAGFPAVADLETMYPFIDTSVGTGSGIAQGTVDKLDDIASLSDIYPDAGWPNGYGTIAGTIYDSDGTTELTGVNVIVRNVANPFGDCSSMLSGAFSQGDAGADGSYVFHGLTPGATYVVYVDEIVAGGFSTPAIFLPGPEEFYNGANESGDDDADDKCESTGIVAVANTVIDADIIFNFALILGDDDSIEVPLPFTFNLCGTDFNSVWIGSNGFVTFGAANTDFSESIPELISGPARIAVLWNDFDPTSGGSITAEQVGSDFVITWDGIPEYATANSNTFSLTLRPDNSFTTDYPSIATIDALVGRAPGNGLGTNSGETDLSAAAQPITAPTGTLIYEQFIGDADLNGDTLDWAACEGTTITIAPATPGVIYATTGSSGASSLYTINPNTGAATLVGPTGVAGIPGLAINSQGEIWGALRVNGNLYRIDANTGQAYFQTATAGIDYLDAMAFGPGDVLYAIGFDPPQFMLRTINTTTGASTVIGSTGDVYVGLAFHPITGVLYGSAGGFDAINPDGIATINTATGAATLLGTTGLGGATPDLVFDTFSNLYGVKGGGQGANDFILVNQGNAAGSVVGPTGFGPMSGMASWIEPVVPTLLQAFDANAAADKVTLQWRVHTTGDDLAGFRVHRRDANGQYAMVGELASNVRTFDDANIAAGSTYMYKLEIVSTDNTSFFSPEIEVATKALKLELAQNHPNPFNPTTTIGYTVPTRDLVTLEIYDVAGRLVTTLVNESADAGRHTATWNGRSANGNPVGSGVYFYRLTVGKQSMTKKMVLLK